MSHAPDAATLNPLADRGRAKQRDRRILLSILAGMPFRLLQIGSGVLLVPLAVRYLGTERFGLWAAITALAPIVALADLGIGNGLINAVSATMARDDTAATRRATASSFAAVAAMAGLLLALLAGLAQTIDWAGLFNVAGTAAEADASPATLAYIACCLALLPLTLVSRLRAGLQESFVSSGWEAAGVATALLAFILAIRSGCGMAALLIAIGLPPVVAGIGNGLSLLSRRSWLRPRRIDIDFAALRPVLRLGFLYFILMAATALANTVDSIVAIRMFGPESASLIGITGKIFGAGQALVLAALTPLWPAFSEALARRDLGWVRRTLLLALAAGAGGGGLVAASLALVTNPAVHLWVGPGMTIPPSLLIANAIWLTLIGTGNAFGMLLNGAGIVRLQIVAALAYSGLAFGLKLILPHYLEAAGIVWATVIAYGAIVVPLYARSAWRYVTARPVA
jgi:O-antigen/teichoic acid export membrane protein